MDNERKVRVTRYSQLSRRLGKQTDNKCGQKIESEEMSHENGGK